MARLCSGSNPLLTTDPKRTIESAEWVALLGRRDTPTDGVEDYSTFLGQALKTQGVNLERWRLPWAEIGWIRALNQLWLESSKWRGKWALIQYTALGWSRRGFPFRVLAVLAVLRWRGVRSAVVFHEPFHQTSTLRRWINPIRGVCQDWVIRRLYRNAERGIFTAPLNAIAWLSGNEENAAFIPIGANIPECLISRTLPKEGNQEKSIIVFGITGAPATEREVDDIVAVMRASRKSFDRLRLVVIGRGAIDARDRITKSMAGSDVEVVVRGILPAEEIAGELSRADLLLFVRGPLTFQRGSAIAGIACGLPIAGYRDVRTDSPLAEAGIEWASLRDRDELCGSVVRVLRDPAHWMELHQRNLEVQRNYFSWDKIAARYLGELR